MFLETMTIDFDQSSCYFKKNTFLWILKTKFKFSQQLSIFQMVYEWQLQ